MEKEFNSKEYQSLIVRLGNKTHSREERYLISFAADFERFLQSGEWFVNNLEKAKEVSNTYWEFISAFESLKEKMSEFRWSSDFLKKKGINFPKIQRLYFAVAAASV